MNEFTSNKLKELGFIEDSFISVVDNFSQAIEANLQKTDINRKKIKRLKQKIESTSGLYDEFKNEIKSNDQELIESLEQTIKAVEHTCRLLEKIESSELEVNFELLTILRNIWEFQRVLSFEIDKNESWLNFLTLVLYEPRNESEYADLKANKKANSFWKLYKGK